MLNVFSLEGPRLAAANLIAELKRRRVFRVVVGYGLVAFALLQVVEPIQHGLHLPDAMLTYLVVSLALGFPVTVMLGWAFDMTARGLERTPPVLGAAASLRGVRLGVILVALGVLVAAPGLAWYFLLRAPGSVGASTEVTPAPAAQLPSIAVLPFTDMSAQHDQEYFSDGIAEEILNALDQLEGLQIAGRTSSFSFKGGKWDLREIGRKLSVAHVLEGSAKSRSRPSTSSSPQTDRTGHTRLHRCSPGAQIWTTPSSGWSAPAPSTIPACAQSSTIGYSTHSAATRGTVRFSRR